jgi:hypothetical protein
MSSHVSESDADRVDAPGSKTGRAAGVRASSTGVGVTAGGGPRAAGIACSATAPPGLRGRLGTPPSRWPGRRHHGGGGGPGPRGLVALMFAGAPGLGDVDLAGLGSLTHPAGEQADLGTDYQEQPVPPVVADPGPDDAATTPDRADPSIVPDASTATALPALATTSSATTTTTSSTPTSTLPGNGPGSAVPSPNSTVPDHGGPPTSRPGGR